MWNDPICQICVQLRGNKTPTRSYTDTSPVLPSPKLTVCTWKWLEYQFPFWDGLFSGAFAASFRECFCLIQKRSATCVFTEEMGLSVGGWTLKVEGRILEKWQVPWATRTLGKWRSLPVFNLGWKGYLAPTCASFSLPSLWFRMLVSTEHHQNSKLLDLKQENNKSPGLKWSFYQPFSKPIFIGTLTWVKKPHLLSQH